MQNCVCTNKSVSQVANDVLELLTTQEHNVLATLPKDQRGIYGLIDHEGNLKYIGSTSSEKQSFYTRVYQRHRTGSENMSHYFSNVYNVGRLWRDRRMQQGCPDAKIAKDLRSSFIAKHCRAVYVPILGSKPYIEEIEERVISLCPNEFTEWNRARLMRYSEPVDLVDELMDELQFTFEQRCAVQRQLKKFDASHARFNSVC